MLQTKGWMYRLRRVVLTGHCVALKAVADFWCHRMSRHSDVDGWVPDEEEAVEQYVCKCLLCVEGVERSAHFVNRLNIIWIPEDTMAPPPLHRHCRWWQALLPLYSIRSKCPTSMRAWDDCRQSFKTIIL